MELFDRNINYIINFQQWPALQCVVGVMVGAVHIVYLQINISRDYKNLSKKNIPDGLRSDASQDLVYTLASSSLPVVGIDHPLIDISMVKK